MPLRSIVIIVLRLFILSWLLQAIAMYTSAALAPLPHERTFELFLSLYGPASLFLVIAVGLWLIAPFVARIVSRGADSTMAVGSLSRPDLYSFAFVFLGLYFVLSSIADTINWIHYFATVSAKPDDLNPRIQNLYQLTKPLMTFAVGLICLLGAPRWTKRVVAYERKHHEA
jgi:hypothetical protein